MEIRSFIELCAGNWLSQRTSYFFAQETSESQRSELAIAPLLPSDLDLIAFCQQYEIAADQTLGGWAIGWESSKDWDSPKQEGAAILVFIADPASTSTGQILRGTGSADKADKPALQGRYKLGLDEALTLSLQEGDLQAEERIWFASDNLRLRTTVFKQGENYQQTAFYSEIRKLSTPAKEA